MNIQIDETRCTGCGGCVEACPTGAISLTNGVAMVDQTLCAQCRACIDVCPVGAIAAVPDTSMVVQPPVAVANIPEAKPVSISPKPWLVSALAFAGREIVPRLADVLIVALENRLTRPKTVSGMASMPSNHFTGQGRGQRRQARYRGGRNR
ncbi:MAG: 4Fe-4S binding protein [Anaerolineae bacterium]|nr:4Fe-4S binding protein [Anaerolineae bacterium]